MTRWNGEKDIEIDLNIPAIESAMRVKGVPRDNQWDILIRVRKLLYAVKKAKGDEEK